MICARCKKECMESELTNGFCAECFSKFKGDTIQLKNIENNIATMFKTFSIICIILGVIIALFAFLANSGLFITLLVLCSFLVVAALLRAIAEIIQLLEDIKNK